MPSEKAKALAQKQRAEATAAKQAKRNSSDPRDWGTIKQLRETYRVTAEVDKTTTPWVVGSFLVVLALCVVLGLLAHLVVWGILIGILLGFSAAVWILTRKAKGATYIRYKDQTGGGQVPLMMLNSKKWSHTAGIAADRTGTIVHRAVGPAGLVLIGEGSHPSKVKMLLNSERKRHEQILQGIPVTSIVMGDGEGEVPIDRLTKHIEKLPATVNKVDLADLESRLKAMDSMRQRAPLPRGPLPNSRGMRRAMRGR